MRPARLLRPLGIGCALLMVSSGCPAKQEPEPIIQGRPLKAWIEDAKNANPQVRAQSIPALAEALTNQQGHVRPEVVTALTALGPEAEAAVPSLIQILINKRGYDVAQVRKALVAIGPKAVPALIKTRAASNQHQDAARTRSEVDGMLRELGQQAVPELILLLNDNNPDIKSNAGAALKMLDLQAAREGVR